MKSKKLKILLAFFVIFNVSCSDNNPGQLLPGATKHLSTPYSDALFSDWEEITIVPSRLSCTQVRDSISALSPSLQLVTWQRKLSYVLYKTNNENLKNHIQTLLNELDTMYFINSNFESNEMRVGFMQNWETEALNIINPTDFLVMFQIPLLIEPNNYILDWPAGLPAAGPGMSDCECSGKSDYCDPFWVDTGTHCDPTRCTPPSGGCGTLYLYKCNGICAPN